MEVGYKKDVRHNYMIIEEESERPGGSFCIRMLEHQTIEGILPVEKRNIDNRALLYYDISGKQAIVNLLEKSALSGSKVKELCSGIIMTVERAYEYLLPEEDFLLSPEFIYQDISTEMPYLCLYPGYGKGIREQMESLLEYLMNKVDYNDKDAVYLVYQLYAVSKEDGCTFAQLKDVLHHRENNTQCQEKDSAEKTIKRTGGNAGNTGKNIGIYGAEAMEEVSDIPVVMEKVEGEAELPCYSMKTYLAGIGCILGGVLIIIISMLTKILYNPFGNRIDYSKLAALLLVLFCLEGYALSKIFNKKNKITKMVKTTEYIDPTEDYIKKTKADVREIGKVTDITGSRADIGSSDDLSPQNKSRFKNDWNEASSTDCGEDEVSAPTCLLNASIENANRPLLKAQEGAGYKDIPILSFPFFIGKLKKNVDYCLDNDMVSRYHAKITREGEFYYLTDLNSTNGTYINQELLQTYQRKEIKFGDEISFANIRYRFMQV